MSFVSGIISYKKNEEHLNKFEKYAGNLKNYVFDGTERVKDNDFYLLKHFVVHRTEDQNKKHILYDSDTNNYFVINGRIDNIRQLRGELKIESNDKFVSDVDLLRIGFKAKGKKFLNSLNGSFVIIIFNKISKKLICCSDHIRSKPLYYHLSENYFIFSNEISLISRFIAEKLKVNKARVIDHLITLYGEKNETFYENICKLNRSEIIEVNHKKITSEDYFAFNPYQVSKFSKLEECANAFEEIFNEVIEDQIYGLERVGSKLSGGVDSSGITSVIAKNFNINLIAYSAYFKNLDHHDHQKTDESKYIEAILKKHSIKSEEIYLDAASTNPLNYINKYYSQATPHLNRYFEVEILKKAKSCNEKVLFDGFDGDSVLSYGFEYFFELGNKFKLVELCKQAKAFHKNKSYFFILKHYVLKQHIPYITNLYYSLKQNLQINLRNGLVRKSIKNYKFKDISKNLIDYRNKRNIAPVQKYHLRTLEWPVWDLGLECADQDQNYTGVEERYPFFDKRIMEFCLSVPGKYRINNGINRYYYREALKSYLPAICKNRLTKANISPLVVNFLGKNKHNIHKSIKDSPIDSYIDINFFEKNILKPFSNGENKVALSQLIFQIYSLSQWLKKIE
tara:strand:+ start:36 stop:1904 length:1869 start_codon:yes stop_codon:yes gene_type:complete